MQALSAVTRCDANESAGEGSALALTLMMLKPWLSQPEVTELCINRPGEAFIETRSGWHRQALAFADVDWCRRFAKLVANATRQRIDETSPLLSAGLPGGERVQIVLPPATSKDCVAITIRRPSDQVWSLAQLAQRGLFDSTRSATTELDEVEGQLLGLLQDR